MSDVHSLSINLSMPRLPGECAPSRSSPGDRRRKPLSRHSSFSRTSFLDKCSRTSSVVSRAPTSTSNNMHINFKGLVNAVRPASTFNNNNNNKLQSPGLSYMQLSRSTSSSCLGMEVDPLCVPRVSQNSSDARRSRVLSRSKSLSKFTAHFRPRVSFDYLVKSRKFTALIQLLEHTQMDDEAARKWLNKHCLHGETPLHKLLRYRPPLKLVDMIIAKMIELHAGKKGFCIPETACDDAGRTPLHIAAFSNCDADVLERLLEGTMGMMPIFTRDALDRLPLHYACTTLWDTTMTLSESSKENVLSVSPSTSSSPRTMQSIYRTPSTRSLLSISLSMVFSSSMRRNSLAAAASAVPREWAVDVVRALVYRYPESIFMRDRNGYTPLELAQQFNAPANVIKILMHAVKLNKILGKVAKENHEDEEEDDDEEDEVGEDDEKEGGSESRKKSHRYLQEISVSQGFEDDVSSIGWGEAGRHRRTTLAPPSPQGAVELVVEAVQQNDDTVATVLQENEAVVTIHEDKLVILAVHQDYNAVATVHQDNLAVAAVHQDNEAVATVHQDNETLVTVHQENEAVVIVHDDNETIITVNQDKDAAMTFHQNNEAILSNPLAAAAVVD